MNELPCKDKGTTFYSVLEGLEGLDKRDARGKRHDFSMGLLGVSLALLSKWDGNLSSIQWHMKRHYAVLCAYIV